MNFERMPTQTKNWFKDILHTVAFFGAFILFAVGGLTGERVVRAAGHVVSRGAGPFFWPEADPRLFRIFVGYMRIFGLVELEASELSGLRNGAD